MKLLLFGKSRILNRFDDALEAPLVLVLRWLAIWATRLRNACGLLRKVGIMKILVLFTITRKRELSLVENDVCYVSGYSDALMMQDRHFLTEADITLRFAGTEPSFPCSKDVAPACRVLLAWRPASQDFFKSSERVWLQLLKALATITTQAKLDHACRLHCALLQTSYSGRMNLGNIPGYYFGKKDSCSEIVNGSI